MTGLTSIELFAGAGGGLLGTALLGHTTSHAFELDPYRWNVLSHQHPHVRAQCGDITDVDWREVDCDAGNSVVCAGFPCQSWSSAGSRKGMDDPRGQLWFEVVRCLRALRPQYVVLENSPRLGTSKQGLSQVLGDLRKVGYPYARWMILPASAIGAPHYRARWWCVASNTILYPNPLPVTFRHINVPSPWDLTPPSPLARSKGGIWRRQVAALGDGQVPAVKAVACFLLGLPYCKKSIDPFVFSKAQYLSHTFMTSNKLTQTPTGWGRMAPYCGIEHFVPPFSQRYSTWEESMIPTPTVGDSRGSGSRNTATSKAHPGVSLTDWSKGDGGTGRRPMLPTPGKADAKSGGPGKSVKVRGTPQLRHLVPLGGQHLNPRFVEWMMGWPMGYFDRVMQ